MLIASCASAATAEGALGIAVAAVTIVFVVMYGVLLQSCAEKCSAAIRRAAALLLLALWVVAAGVLTFRGPFVATGNGYFAVWIGFACSIAASSVRSLVAPSSMKKPSAVSPNFSTVASFSGARVRSGSGS